MTDPNHRDYCLQAFDKFLETLPKEKRGVLLDVGCRDAVLQKPLEERGFTWVGVDSIPAVERILVAKMEELTCVKDNSIDLLFACHSFEHCERPVDALREFRRVLKSGGWLFIATPFPCNHHILEADPDHIFVLMPIQMIRLLIYANFSHPQSIVWPGNIEQNHTIVSVGMKE